MASPETPLQKTLRIKTAVVTRVKKELDQYKVDLDAQREKVETMRAEDRDEFDIRQQQEVFNETERVIPDTIRRLQRAVEELNEFVTVNRAAEDIAGSSVLTTAIEVLAAEGIEAGAEAVADEAI